MSIEKPLSKPSVSEARETKDSLQKSADSLFDALAPYYVTDEEMREAIDEQADRAMSALLSEDVSKRLGEKTYEVSRQDNYSFFLARREPDPRKWDFDPKDSLGIFAKARLDLPTGRVSVDYDVNVMSKDREGWDKDNFDVELLKDVHIEKFASPEAIKNVYDKLEGEYEKELTEYKRKLKAFDPLVACAFKHQGQRLGVEDWAKQPLLNEIWPWAAEVLDEWEIIHRKSDEGEDVQLVIFQNGRVIDVADEKKPQKPERWF